MLQSLISWQPCGPAVTSAFHRPWREAVAPNALCFTVNPSLMVVSRSNHPSKKRAEKTRISASDSKCLTCPNDVLDKAPPTRLHGRNLQMHLEFVKLGFVSSSSEGFRVAGLECLLPRCHHRLPYRAYWVLSAESDSQGIRFQCESERRASAL
jgi:hypothetical protein